MYIAGSSPTNVFAGTRRDMVPQALSGSFNVMGIDNNPNGNIIDKEIIRDATGSFKIQNINTFTDVIHPRLASETKYSDKRITFDPSSTVGVGPVVGPRLWCVYLGLPES